MIHHELLIVGGGAAGLMAAVTAKDFGIDVAILEATDRIGKKILATGNGRCNISNISITEPLINYHSNNDNFYYESLKSFSVKDTLDFFLALGLPIVELQSSKLYPQSLQASSVVEIFRLALEDRNIPVYTGRSKRTPYLDLAKTGIPVPTHRTGKRIAAVIRISRTPHPANRSTLTG